MSTTSSTTSITNYVRPPRGAQLDAIEVDSHMANLITLPLKDIIPNTHERALVAFLVRSLLFFNTIWVGQPSPATQMYNLTYVSAIPSGSSDVTSSTPFSSRLRSFLSTWSSLISSKKPTSSTSTTNLPSTSPLPSSPPIITTPSLDSTLPPPIHPTALLRSQIPLFLNNTPSTFTPSTQLADYLASRTQPLTSDNWIPNVTHLTSPLHGLPYPPPTSTSSSSSSSSSSHMTSALPRNPVTGGQITLPASRLPLLRRWQRMSIFCTSVLFPSLFNYLLSLSADRLWHRLPALHPLRRLADALQITDTTLLIARLILRVVFLYTGKFPSLTHLLSGSAFALAYPAIPPPTSRIAEMDRQRLLIETAVDLYVYLRTHFDFDTLWGKLASIWRLGSPIDADDVHNRNRGPDNGYDQDLSSLSRVEIAKCAQCGESPRIPQLASCGHVMCHYCAYSALHTSSCGKCHTPVGSVTPWGD